MGHHCVWEDVNNLFVKTSLLNLANLANLAKKKKVIIKPLNCPGDDDE